MILAKPTRSRATCAISLTLIAALVSGCAGYPLVRWQPPTREANDDGSSLAYARRYTATVRTTYQNEIYERVKAGTDLNNALLGAGALVLLLGASHVHRDPILGVSLLAGTGYAYGNLNQSKPRLLVYQAGVEALNCASRAVIPFNISAADEARLTAVIAELSTSRGALAATVDRVKSLDPDEEAKRMLERAASVDTAAGESLAAAHKFIGAVRRAGDELIHAVDRIDAAVVRAALDTVPDMSAVPKIIAGLAGMAGSFAPGAGVDKLLVLAPLTGKALASSAGSQRGGEKTALQKAIDELRTVVDKVAADIAVVNALVLGRETTLAPDGFKDCGVAEVSMALTAMPQLLKFVAGKDAERSITISGGIRPYLVELDGTPVEGVTLQQPVPFERRARVTVKSSVAAGQELTATVMDSSNPTRSHTVRIAIDAAAGATQPPNSVNAAQTTAAQLAAAVKSDAMAPVFGPLGVALVDAAPMPSLAAGKVSVTVQLKCTKTPRTPKPSLEEIAKEIASALPANSKALSSALNIDPRALGACVKL